MDCWKEIMRPSPFYETDKVIKVIKMLFGGVKMDELSNLLGVWPLRNQ